MTRPVICPPIRFLTDAERNALDDEHHEHLELLNRAMRLYLLAGRVLDVVHATADPDQAEAALALAKTIGDEAGRLARAGREHSFISGWDLWYALQRRLLRFRRC